MISASDERHVGEVDVGGDAGIQFDEFDAWHFYGRTAKHGAFMGGADFVQWHGNYELLRLRASIDDAALKLRAGHAPK